MSERAEGYYWVLHGFGWEPAYYYNFDGYSGWRCIGYDMDMKDSDWYEIDEQPIAHRSE